MEKKKVQIVCQKWIKIENHFEKLSVSKFICTCRYNVLSHKKLPSKFHGIIIWRFNNEAVYNIKKFIEQVNIDVDMEDEDGHCDCCIAFSNFCCRWDKNWAAQLIVSFLYLIWGLKVWTVRKKVCKGKGQFMAVFLILKEDTSLQKDML